jgi:hypothetical protein
MAGWLGGEDFPMFAATPWFTSIQLPALSQNQAGVSPNWIIAERDKARRRAKRRLAWQV